MPVIEFQGSSLKGSCGREASIESITHKCRVGPTRNARQRNARLAAPDLKNQVSPVQVRPSAQSDVPSEFVNAPAPANSVQRVRNHGLSGQAVGGD
jgi:hypothetical protein